MVALIVNHAKLPRGHAMNLVKRMNHGLTTVQRHTLACHFKIPKVVFWSVPNLKRDRNVTLGQFAPFEISNMQRGSPVTFGRFREPVQVVNLEVFLVCGVWIVTMTDIQNITRRILLHHKPRPAAKAKPLALPNGMKPMTLVTTHQAPRFKLNDVALKLSNVSAHILIVVYIAQETDTLRVFAAGIDKVLTLGDLAHLALLVVPYGKDSLAQLPTLYLREKVGLVLHGVRARG